MGAEPRRDGTNQSDRVESLAAMCRQLTAELFVEPEPEAPAPPVAAPPVVPTTAAPSPVAARPAPLPPVAPPAASNPSPATNGAERQAGTELIIPPAQTPPVRPAQPIAQRTAPPQPVAEASAIDPAAKHRAEQSLADLRPRRFESVAEVPTVRALDGVTRDVPAAPDASGQSIARLSNRDLTIDAEDAEALPRIPNFLGPTQLTVSEGDRPAAVRTAPTRSLFDRLPVPGRKLPFGDAPRNSGRVRPPTKSEPGQPLRLGAPEQAPPPPEGEPRAARPKTRRRFPVGALTGVAVFVAVASAAVAGAAVAPRLADLVTPANAPHIEVAEVEGIADALVPLPLIVDAATGTTLSSVVIDGVPQGARLNAGLNSGDGSWILPPDQLPNLALVPPRGFAGELSLSISAVAVDGLERVSQTATLHVTIMPHNRTPQIHASRRI